MSWGDLIDGFAQSEKLEFQLRNCVLVYLNNDSFLKKKPGVLFYLMY